MKALRITAITIYAAFLAKNIYAVIASVCVGILLYRNSVKFHFVAFGQNLFVFMFIFLGVVVLTRVGFIVLSMVFSLQKNFNAKKSTILLIWFFVNTLLFHLSPAAFMTETTSDLVNWGMLNTYGATTLLLNITECMAAIFVFVVLLLTALQGRKEMMNKEVST